MRILMVAAALALAGCQQAAQTNNATSDANAAAAEANAVGNASGEGNVAAQVVAMNDRERNLTLNHAIIDANLKCDGVVSSERLPDQNGLPVWKAHCLNGNAHIITITPDGIAHTVSRVGT